jgi:hypothetical protein
MTGDFIVAPADGASPTSTSPFTRAGCKIVSLRRVITLAAGARCGGRAHGGAIVTVREKYGFKSFDLIEGQSDARPQPTAMWLPIQAIQKAE